MTATDSHPSRPGELPDPLPHPLDDPLRFYRKLLNFLLIPLFCSLLLVGFFVPRLGGADWGLTFYQIESTFTFVLIVAVWRLLPRKVTTAIYLRSFRSDPVAYPIRTQIARAIGPEFRLSGIRDPRRRWPWILRHLVYLLFLVRYCRPRFMNLEAGPDWKARLWRSLGLARCAFVDLTEITPFVLEEVQLALQSLGSERVLFVVDTSRSLSTWKEDIASRSAVTVPVEALRVAVWEDTPKGRRSFADAVRCFVAQVPREAAGLNPAAWGLTHSQEPLHGRSGGRELAFVELGIATVLSAGLFMLEKWLAGSIPLWLHLLWKLPLLSLAPLTVIFLIQYLIESGSKRDWWVTGALFGFVGLLSAGLITNEWLNPPEGIRGAADRTISTSNLKQIGYGMLMYHDDLEQLPPAIGYTATGKPHVSWRVLLLPHLGQTALYQAYHLDEPWDSPHNLKLLNHMPLIYRSSRFLTQSDPTKTSYRVFLGRDTPLGRGVPGSNLPFRQMLTGLGANGAVPIGTFDGELNLDQLKSVQDTILVVEAKEAVPWTKPEELDIEAFAFQDPHLFLGNSRRGFQALMGSGDIRMFEHSEKHSAAAWKTFFTVNPAEVP